MASFSYCTSPRFITIDCILAKTISQSQFSQVFPLTFNYFFQFFPILFPFLTFSFTFPRSLYGFRIFFAKIQKKCAPRKCNIKSPYTHMPRAPQRPKEKTEWCYSRRLPSPGCLGHVNRKKKEGLFGYEEFKWKMQIKQNKITSSPLLSPTMH